MGSKFKIHREALLILVASAVVNSAPTALSVAPSEQFDGVDGSWASFTVALGTPEQLVRLFPSTSGNAIFPIDSSACQLTAESDPCAQARGSLFTSNLSSSYHFDGIYQASLLEEQELNFTLPVNVGSDNVTFGLPGSGAPMLLNQVIEAGNAVDFYVGSFGINPQAVNLSTLINSYSSPLGSLVQQGEVPSHSWAYGAGASYAQPPDFGSLTLGGYDQTRFTPNGVNFPFGSDQSRDLLVGIHRISTDVQTSPLLSTGILAFMDSMIPQMYLPIVVCQAFESAFNLTYNDSVSLYTISDQQHTSLLSLNPSITFILGPQTAGGSSLEITLPYAAFDLEAQAPFVQSPTRYFPLQRADNSSEYTLGRVFFQEAYVIANYDNSTFTVSQALHPANPSVKQLQAIGASVNSHSTNSSKGGGLSGGAIAGIVIGVVAGLLLVAGLLWFLLGRKKKSKTAELEAAERKKSNAELESAAEKRGDPTVGHGRQESAAGWAELDAKRTQEKNAQELGGNYISEMPSPPVDHGPAELHNTYMQEMPTDSVTSPDITKKLVGKSDATPEISPDPAHRFELP